MHSIDSRYYNAKMPSYWVNPGFASNTNEIKGACHILYTLVFVYYSIKASHCVSVKIFATDLLVQVHLQALNRI